MEGRVCSYWTEDSWTCRMQEAGCKMHEVLGLVSKDVDLSFGVRSEWLEGDGGFLLTSLV